MPPINTSLIAPLPGAEIAQADMSLGNFMVGFGAGIRRTDPLERLKQLSMEQDLHMQAFQIQSAYEDRQRILNAEQTARELAPQIQQQIAAGDPDSAQMAIMDATMRNPMLGMSQSWKAIGDMAVKAGQLKTNRDTLAERVRHNQAMEGAKSDTLPKEEKFADLKRQEQALATALAKVGFSDPLQKAEVQRNLTDVQNKLAIIKPAGMKVHLSYDDQGRPILDLGQGEPTVGTQTAIQTDLAGIRNSLTQIDMAKSALTEKDVGVAGTVWDSLLNKWGEQLAPGIGDPSVSANRVQLQKAVDSYLASEQNRGRLSAPERAAIRDALVTRKLGESLPRAQAVLDSMSRIQKFEAIAKAKAGKQPLDTWMFNGLKRAEIRQLYKEGTLTAEEAVPWVMKAQQ